MLPFWDSWCALDRSNAPGERASERLTRKRRVRCWCLEPECGAEATKDQKGDTSPALATPPPQTQQEQCQEANALCRDQRWSEHMQAAAEQNEDQTWPDQWSRCRMLPHGPSVFGDGVSSGCVGGFLVALLDHQRFNPWIQRDFLHLGARSKSSPSRQLIKFIKFGVNRLAQCFPAFLGTIREERM